MYRTTTCGELRIANLGQTVTLAGWVQRIRKMGGMTFIDLRDRYGMTQLVFNQEVDADLCERANHLGREYVLQVTGKVEERSSKNSHMPTGDIEIIVSTLNAKYIHASLGLRYLVANMRDLQPVTTLCEFTINRKTEELATELLAKNPKIIGFGVYIWNVLQTCDLVKLLKSQRPDIKIKV